MSHFPDDQTTPKINEQAARRGEDLAHMIPRDITMICPHCHKEVMHQVRRYRDHDLCTCSSCGRHWQVDFTEPASRDYFYVVQENLMRTRELLNGLLGQVTTHQWGRYQTQKDRQLIGNLRAGLSHGLRALNSFIRGVEQANLPEGEPDGAEAWQPRSVSDRANDYPWQFRRTIEGRVYHGMVFLPTNEDAVDAAKQVRRRFAVPARSLVITPSDDYPQERYLVIIPREPEAPLEDLRLKQASEFLSRLAAPAL
jgi:hypothetical protein